MHRLISRAVVCLIGCLPLTAPQASVIGWSFSNVVGGIAGTVSGTLEVSEGIGVSATSVVLTSTTNSIFDSLVGVDFTALPNFQNQFNVVSGEIIAAQFGTDFFANSTNLNLELNSGAFGDPNSQNNGLLTIAGNPLRGACPDECLQTSLLTIPNEGQTQFAPNFFTVPEPTIFALMGLGLAGIGYQRRKEFISV